MKVNQTSKSLRQSYKLLRNDYPTNSKWGIPNVKKCTVDITGIKLIGIDKTKKVDNSKNIAKSVHFFVEDTKIERVYNYPEGYIYQLAQYPHVLTPDYSMYRDMPLAVQLISAFKNRWCGAYWQEHKISVIPTVSWSTIESFDFCFDGLEYETVVAISTLGGLTEKEHFLRGYFEMRDRINPKQVLCFGKPFSEMGDEVIMVNYLESTGRVK
jgi:hypothetical protein